MNAERGPGRSRRPCYFVGSAAGHPSSGAALTAAQLAYQRRMAVHGRALRDAKRVARAVEDLQPFDQDGFLPEAAERLEAVAAQLAASLQVLAGEVRAALGATAPAVTL